MFRSLLILCFGLFSTSISAQNKESIKEKSTSSYVHVKSGSVYTIPDHMTVKHIARHQSYNGRDTVSYDKDIHSPKSVTLNPSGTRYYVNSLEGHKTVCYDVQTHEKVASIKHFFTDKDSALWAKPSGLYEFNHKYAHPNTFSGKPVESAFTHMGRYLWVPYYRRSFDINAQDPSAISVIDTRTHKIVRLFETGALPKMVESSADGKWVAVSQWGENTVGLIDVSSLYPDDWHYENSFTIDRKLKLNYSLTVRVNRDVNSGYCLRGTVFTPDNRYLLVGCMGGSGGIAVIDLEKQEYLGRVMGMLPNVRHIVLHDNWMYLSINQSGAVQRIPLDKFIASFENFEKHVTKVEGWETCKVLKGARTISISADGRYVYAACNIGSRLAVVDTQTFKMVGEIPVDSYPVGLDISADGLTLYVTSQGRDDKGGNSVNVYQIEYL